MAHTEFYRGLTEALRALGGLTTPRGDLPTAARRATVVHAAIQPHLDRTPMAAAGARACGAGCDACCHFPVGITFAEAERLADALLTATRLAERITEAAAATAATDWHGLAGRPCPLLDGATCGVYEARPLPCRALASADATACRAALTQRVVVPRDDEAFALGLGATAALCQSAGTPAPASETATRELRAGVAAILAARADGAAEASRRARFLLTRPAQPTD